MNALDSPLEALAFNYLSYGFLTAVNNIWAWVAVITAAISFWRINWALSSSPLVAGLEQCGSSEDVASTSSSPPKTAEVEATEPATCSTPGETKQYLLSASSTTSCCASDSEGSPKVKFSLYYNEHDFMEIDEGGADDGDDGCNGGTAVVRKKLGYWWCEDWQRKMLVRMRDMGWYKCQDLTVLDGSVVQLWDGRRPRYAAAPLVADGGVAW